MRFRFDNSYARELTGLYVARQPDAAPAPQLLHFNEALAESLGLRREPGDDEAALAALFAGRVLPEGAEPIAQAYAGHQFGGFSPSLGDGRALLLGEQLDPQGRRHDIAFKGSGRTPFSRGGDGKAAVGPMLRELLVSESLHALGVPTTRALAVVATGETVRRDQPLPGAVLTRTAASHLRVGTFQYFAARGEQEPLQRLLAYTLARHDPELIGREDVALGLLEAVIARQARLIAQWMNLGFIHGVMNTDNMTISGETIDYGPCAFMEAYDPAAVFSSIDHHGRYAYGNQPGIAQWNLARLAEALLPLFPGIADDTDACVAQATEALDRFPALYEAALREGQRAKLGLRADAEPALIDEWLQLLQQHQLDFTQAHWQLAHEPEALAPLQAWLPRWQAQRAPDAEATMRAANPWIIPRNHRVEEALAAASERGDLTPTDELLAALRQPFRVLPERARYAEPAPAAQTACYQTFCGT